MKITFTSNNMFTEESLSNNKPKHFNENLIAQIQELMKKNNLETLQVTK